MLFVDRVEIFVKGGKGGDGCLSFRREKFVPRGGPDGGDGGDGGNVIIQAIPETDSLAQLSHQRHWKAPRGAHGQGSNCTGKSGEDLVIAVPPGTVVRDREHGFVLKDLDQPDSSVVIARGGKGGKGNTRFKSATNQAPREFEYGQEPEERWVVLELKSIADVGLIGLPNAGKSTLLSRISKAQPEIADYPFTTKYPNLGICYRDPETSCVVADIPGLIEGASEGVGLGHEFLKHVERTRLLVHLIDCMPMDESDPLENYHAIRKELQEYSPALAEKPEIVAVSKSELGVTDELLQQVKEQTGRPVMAISSVTGEGLDRLIQTIFYGLEKMDGK